MLRLASAKSQPEIRNFHKQMLKRAEEELKKTSPEDFERRLITGITITADPDKIEVAKKMLSDALHEIANLLGEGEAESLLRQTLHEEKETDKKLSQLAEHINLEAEQSVESESSNGKSKVMKAKAVRA